MQSGLEVQDRYCVVHFVDLVSSGEIVLRRRFSSPEYFCFIFNAFKIPLRLQSSRAFRHREQAAASFMRRRGLLDVG